MTPLRTRRCVFGGSDEWLRHDTERRLQMSTFSDSYVSKSVACGAAQPRCAARRWRRLTTSLLDPYRPELHYLRGPGPKWRERGTLNSTSTSFSGR
jgi:hypothetical protein